jgi:hypothetical protein
MGGPIRDLGIASDSLARMESSPRGVRHPAAATAAAADTSTSTSASATTPSSQEELLRQRMKGKGTQLAEMILCPIYANLPSELQASPHAGTHTHTSNLTHLHTQRETRVPARSPQQTPAEAPLLACLGYPRARFASCAPARHETHFLLTHVPIHRFTDSTIHRFTDSPNRPQAKIFEPTPPGARKVGRRGPLTGACVGLLSLRPAASCVGL